MFELVVALDKISNNFEADQYGSLLNDLEDADGFKVTIASLLNSALLEAVYWSAQFLKKPHYVLADLKLADVGYLQEDGRYAGTNSEIIETVCNTIPYVTHFTCHAFPGPVSVKEAVKTAEHFGAGILIVTNMSHEGSREMMTFPDYFDYAIRIGEECGAEGYIVPGNDSAALSRAVEMTDKEIWSPGFGRQVALRGEASRPIREQIRDWQECLIKKPDFKGIHRAIVGSYIIGDDEPDKRAAEVKSWVREVQNRI